MSSKVTLGGDRLGAGKKQQVELHGYERSTHDLSYVWRSTVAPGTLVPFMCEVALPGDTFDIDLQAEMLTHPTIGPLFGSFKAQYDVFMVPMRLYNSLLHNNAIGIGLKMDKVLFPTMHVPCRIPDEGEDWNEAQVSSSALIRYLGISGIGDPGTTHGIERTFNAVPFLAYWDIYKQYYTHKSEEIGAYIHNTPASIMPIQSVLFAGLGAPKNIYIGDQVEIISELEIKNISTTPNVNLNFNMDTGLEDAWVNLTNITQVQLPNGNWQIMATYSGAINTTWYGWTQTSSEIDRTQEPNVATFPLSNIDEMRKQLLAHTSTSIPFEVPGNLTPYKWVRQFVTRGTKTIPYVYLNQEQLALKTYQSDLFNNWLNTETIDGTNGINELTKVSTAGDAFTIDSLRLATKVNEMFNRIAVSGGTYDDWLNAVYDHNQYGKPYSPVYLGGLSKEIIFQEVISSAATENNPLGTIAGRGKMSGKHKGGRIHVRINEPCYIMGIASITPRVDYSQGNTWWVHLKHMDNLHKPHLDQIGFQDMIVEDLAYFSSKWSVAQEKFIQMSAGKQPAWIKYMTNVNKTYGNFANESEMWMTLNRRYEYDFVKQVKDLTAYIDPAKFNFIFADTARDAQNFWSQIGVGITARRKMSAKVMPNL